MYGKHFQSTYTGSMVGSGFASFAVWGYVIANTDPQSHVELNPRYLSALLGGSIEEVDSVIKKFCEPDPESRSKENDGRKLIKKGQFLYFVVNHLSYRQIRDESDRREYNKLKQREFRNKKRNEMSNHLSLTVNDSTQKSSVSANTEADTEDKVSLNPLPPKVGGEASEDVFDEIAKAKPKVKRDPDWRDQFVGDDREEKIKVATLFCSFFGRRTSTKWSPAELQCFNEFWKNMDVEQEDLKILEWYYLQSGCKYVRRDLITFLRNIRGEFERAREYKFNPQRRK